MKKVGILTRMDIHNEKEIHYIHSNVFYKIKKYAKVKLIPFAKEDGITDILDDIKECDGIVLQGGDDIYPIEIDVCRFLHENNVPTLGICLGMQTMACAFNGKLDLLPNMSHKTGKKYAHKVILSKDSNLYSILKTEVIIVNSRHKEYVLNTDLKTVGYAEDGTIEAIEDTSKEFYIGLQWHPENLNDKYSLKLFDYFISML